VGRRTAPGRALAVRRLELRDFRNYTALRLEADAAPVVLVGPNGAGKTNLLEALSLFAPGRGLRGAALGDMTRWCGAGEASPPASWTVSAHIEGPAGVLEIGTGLLPAAGESGPRRLVRLNGADASGPAALDAYIAVVWLTPTMDRLMNESPARRRRFLDRLAQAGEPGHARRLAAYDQAMRERTRLLQRGGAERAWLEALERTMAEHGVALGATRLQAVARLGAALATADGPFPRATLAARGQIEDELSVMPATAVEDRFRARLGEARPRDALMGAASEGPHRSEFFVRHGDLDRAAEDCSTGEQKALLLSIILASARLAASRRGIAPLVLLDEVVAHLDARRREALFETLAALGAPAWLTGTDRGLFAPLEDKAQFFVADAGTVRRGRTDS
jgi:DNA replication and repair protein RecF